MTSHRCRTLLLAIGLLWCTGAASQQSRLLVERRGDYLSVSAPQLHFLTGRGMEKLQNGSTVTFVMRLSATPQHGVKAVFSLQEKLVISFDLWEEKYSIVQSRPGGRSASRLTAAMTEAWFLESVKIPIRSIPDRAPFVIRFECRIEENEAPDNGEKSSTLTLAGLIDVFGRKRHEEPIRWEASSGPFRLDDLKK